MATFVDTTALEDGFQYVLPYVTSAPDSVLVFHLRQAAIEFMRRTLCWQMTLDPVSTVIDKTAYAIPFPDDARLVKLLRYDLPNGESGRLTDPRQGRDYRLFNVGADCAWTEDGINFEVVPTPKVAGAAMTLTVALCPTETATEIVTSVFDQFIRQIAYGAVASISSIPRQTFTDDRVAETQQARFIEAIGRVSRQMTSGFGRTQQRSRPFHF